MSPFPSVTTNPRKRIIIEHTDGPTPGLREIMGVWEPLPGHDVPQFVSNVLVLGERRTYGIDLVRTSDRAYWYHEVRTPVPQETV